MQIELLVGRYKRMIGLAWYADSLQKYLTRMEIDFIITQPDYPLPLRIAHSLLQHRGYDLKTFLTTYPISAHMQKRTIKHLTTQQMASLMSFQRELYPVIITVHDIIPFMMRDDPEQKNYHTLYDRWADSLAMNNIKRANIIITDSEYTRRTLIERLKIPSDKIRVVLLGLNLEVFKPTEITEDFRKQFHIDPKCQYILYVGSELPRKNLGRLMDAFAMVKNKNPQARLIKIGSPIQPEYFQKLQDQIRRFDIQNEVILINHVSRNDLISFYNLADVFVFPSLYEGFGIPPLEAMACGAPVICSNSTSLPEVVGDAAISTDPLDVPQWADTISEVLNNDILRNNLRIRSLDRASQFSWERMARETLKVYEEVANLT